MDEKYVDFFINRTELLDSGNHRYLVYSSNKTQAKPNMVKSKEVSFHLYNSPEFWKQVGDINQYQRVFVHYLSIEMAEFINLLPQSLTVIWKLWGSDAFELLKVLDSHELFLPATYALQKEMFKKQQNQSMSIKDAFQNLKLQVGKYLQYLKRIKAARRVNFIATPIEEDVKMVNKKHRLKAKYCNFMYLSESELINDKTARVNGNNIFLGNSATFSNNHIEAMETLSHFDFLERKVICPLSYGNMDYQKVVLEKGREYLGENFYPITEYLSLDEYYQYVYSASVAIMNHNRQQALGNILAFLYAGAKLYLRKTNTVYGFLKSKGIVVYSIEDDLIPQNSEALNALPKDVMEKNRHLIQQFVNESYINQKYLDLFNV